MLLLCNMAVQSHHWHKRILGLNCTQNILVFMDASQHFCEGANAKVCTAGLVAMRNGLAVAALALALLAGPRVYAFQEQSTGAASPPAQAEQPAPEGQPPAEGKPLGLSTETGAKPDSGTEIRIPGLGKLGVLPKMDFGLELLYGAADQKPVGQPEGVPDPNEDITVRGTVKHRF